MTTSPASAGSGSPGAHEDEFDLRLGLQRIEIVEIGDARQHRHGDLQRPRARRAASRSSTTESSAGSRAAAFSQGTTPKQGQPVKRVDRRDARRRTARRRRGTC